MKTRALLGMMAAWVLFTWAFVLMSPRAPGAFVAALTMGTFGAGIFYGDPAARVVTYPWRRLRTWRTVALRARTRLLARFLARVGWNSLVRRPISSSGDLPAFRRDAVSALISHAASLGFHLIATGALLLSGHPWWSFACLGLGVLVHGWPCLLQVEVLIRVDQLQTKLDARGR